MKKLAILILALALTLSLAACGGNKSAGGDNTSNPPASTANNNAADASGKLNPPDWLAGTWKCAEKSETMTITAHNVTVSNGNLDFTWQINNVGLKITESNDGGVYSLAYTAGGMDVKYAFEKQSDGTVKRTLTTGGMDIPQIFTKQ